MSWHISSCKIDLCSLSAVKPYLCIELSMKTLTKPVVMAYLSIAEQSDLMIILS